jgi:gamma-glutamyltranspeptidase
VDAAIAVLLCQRVSNAHDSDLGPGLFMVVFQRSSLTAFALDARKAALVKASRDMFQDNATRQGRGGLLHIARLPILTLATRVDCLVFSSPGQY